MTVFSRIPTVHQDPGKREALLIDQPREHVLEMIQFGFAIALRVINPIVNQPEPILLRIDIDTCNHPEAFDDALGVAAILTTHSRDLARMSLV